MPCCAISRQSMTKRVELREILDSKIMREITLK
jgi:hypothetical protein